MTIKYICDAVTRDVNASDGHKALHWYFEIRHATLLIAYRRNHIAGIDEYRRTYKMIALHGGVRRCVTLHVNGSIAKGTSCN